ncbi:GIY-YIG catalytic domain-containing protein [Xylariaceae sp. AK1471]|nr:GIY-YIG catalytic domain-containing protein [Xylariaceae sp. AK1471]
MPIVSKPIPPLYSVYILRSTVHRASLYIGSTPNPPRRLKQHNGEAKGGAARTARGTLRPWEMVGLVSGFPGMVAALKFEWALNNPHVSLHIPTNSRITIATQRKRNGHPKRPSHSMKSIISNVHLLLRVPSFARWPLKLHFFAPEVHRAWNRHCDDASEPLRKTIPVYTDFGPSQAAADASTSTEPPSPWGIHALPLNYAPMKSYVEKTKSLYSFEREGACVICGENLPHDEGLYATCSNTGCEGTGHVSCWSRHLLGSNAEEDIIPISGHCPKCEGEVTWGEMMTEMSLRLRGQKEVDKILRKPRKRKAPTTAGSP